MIKPKLDQLREASDQELAELFASWFYDCKERLCPIAIEMECAVDPEYKEPGCVAVWKEWLTSRPGLLNKEEQMETETIKLIVNLLSLFL